MRTTVAFLITASMAIAQQREFRTIYDFSPSGGVIPGPMASMGGRLYGTTAEGGAGPCEFGCGTAYSLTPPESPGGAWSAAVLYNFQQADAVFAVTPGPGGVLYGVTDPPWPLGFGTVFSLTPPSSSQGGLWAMTVLYSFLGGSDGISPQGVAVGPGGVLYGVTADGGSGSCATNFGGCGTVFSLTPPASAGGAWTETILYSFTGGSDGSAPSALAIGGEIGGRPILYGTAPFVSPSFGTVFRLTPDETGWNFDTLYTFTGGTDGRGPVAGLAIGSAQGGPVLYGASDEATPENGGMVFTLTPQAAGSPWKLNGIFSPPPRSGGYSFQTPVLDRANGAIYGTTLAGGSDDFGIAYRLTPPSSPGGAWTASLLHTFTGMDDGSGPNALTVGPGGWIYGTAQGGATVSGTAFALKP